MVKKSHFDVNNELHKLYVERCLCHLYTSGALFWKGNLLHWESFVFGDFNNGFLSLKPYNLHPGTACIFTRGGCIVLYSWELPALFYMV